MKLIFLPTLLFSTILICVSCGVCSKKIDCAGFTDTELIKWFPYHDNQQLVFKDSLNEQQIFTLRNTLTTQPYQDTAGMFSPTLQCEAEKVFESMEKDSFEVPRFSVRLRVVADSIKSASLEINLSSVYFDYLSDTGFMRISIAARNTTVQKLANLRLGGQLFNNVIEAIGDTTNEKLKGVYKIYYSKNIGVVAYSEYPSLKTWIKQ